MILKCTTCGSSFDAKEISSWVYGDGKDLQFGRCPQCGAIGRFKRLKRNLKQRSGKDMGEAKPIENTEITHGICRECMAELESE